MVRLFSLLGGAAALALFHGCSGGSGKTVPTTSASPRATATAGVASSPTPSAIAIDQPAEGSPVTAPFEISGTADVFEAALVVSISDASGTLCERAIMATSGTGTRGTWRTTMAFAPPQAAENATIRAFSRSAKDGTEINSVTRSVRVLADVPDIVIAQPRCAADVAGGTPLLVAGTARVFEAALTVELRSPSGAVLLVKHVMADAGAPATGKWSASLDLNGIAAGSYDLVAYDVSARDGTPGHVFSMPIRITV